MCFTLKKNNTRRKKPVNCFLHDDASAGIAVSTDLYCNKTLPNSMERTLEGDETYETDFMCPLLNCESDESWKTSKNNCLLKIENKPPFNISIIKFRNFIFLSHSQNSYQLSELSIFRRITYLGASY